MFSEQESKYVKEAIKGSKEAFSKLYKNYAKSVYKKCYFVTLNKDEALDLFQTIWLKCYLKIRSLRKTESFQSWFNKLINHVLIDYIRQKRQKASFYEIEIFNKNSALEDIIITKLSLEDIFKVLTEEERIIIQMHFIEGLTTREIAQYRDCSISTIKMRIYRAIKKVKKILVKNSLKGKNV